MTSQIQEGSPKLPLPDPGNGEPDVGSDQAGHRKRLRERFLRAGPEGLAEYELLEMLLFAAVPRKDTKPLAKALLKRFGTFAEVVNAPEPLLRREGLALVGIAQLRLVQAAAVLLIRSAVVEKPLLSSWQQVIDYCTAAMSLKTREEFRILFMDKRNRLIADEVQSKGTVDHVPVYVREIVKRALELSSTALVLVHNHPSGDPTPSRADIDMTRQIIQAMRPINVVVHDHIIIGRDKHVSFKGLGLLDGSRS